MLVQTLTEACFLGVNTSYEPEYLAKLGWLGTLVLKKREFLVRSFPFHCLGIDRKLLFFSPSIFYFFLLLNWKQLFIFKALSVHVQHITKVKMRLLDWVVIILREVVFINFHSDLAESWRVESSEAFMKPNLCTSHTFHACPCSVST